MAHAGSFAYGGYNPKGKGAVEETIFEDDFSKTRLTQKALKKFVAEKLQPRQNAYNGIGMAKPSVFVALDNDNFREMFEEVM